MKKKLLVLINYFENIEKDEKVLISTDGYEKLLLDLEVKLPNTNLIIKNEFEIQDESVFKSSLLLDYNIKPQDSSRINR